MKQDHHHQQGQCSSSYYSSSSYQQNNMMHQQNMMMSSDDMIFGGGGGRDFISNNNMNMNMNMNMMMMNMFPSSSDHQNMQQPWSMPYDSSSSTFIMPPPPPQPYASFFNSSRRMIHTSSSASVGAFDLQAELSKMSAQEIMEAKALAASKSHSEAERRRRERINNHLSKLRTLLPSTTKTDKASLLAEVIEHVKELKRQTSLIAETTSLPSESDELTVHDASDEDGNFVIKASLCCQDRSDLLPQLITTLKSMNLRTLKADITTLGGRVKNVLFITSDQENYNHDDDDDNGYQYCITSIQEALKAVMEKINGADSGNSASVKRQRTNNNIISSIS
ncbi:Transcription factor bHLH30 [Stylosanthes scabra]|uniref:Transcription factor bHLH30 n=1 Tax=Stylosanthes scabra TaxID=79078 RepID=A0ABU6VWJ7_9FABA|nr:Transcription factor bHLH30 [Stylosanthes scabra]